MKKYIVRTKQTDRNYDFEAWPFIAQKNTFLFAFPFSHFYNARP